MKMHTRQEKADLILGEHFLSEQFFTGSDYLSITSCRVCGALLRYDTEIAVRHYNFHFPEI